MPRNRTAPLALAALLTACATQARYERSVAVPPPPDDVLASVYLVGDAGLTSDGQKAVLEHLSDDLARAGDSVPGATRTVVFLGDNIYEVGARDEFRQEDLARLAPQAAVVHAAPATRAVFLPGNHDWGHGAGPVSARTAIRTQQRWLYELVPDSTARLLPTDGCPGPEVVDIAAGVSLVVIDTEWLLRLPEDECGGADRFHERLGDVLRARGSDRIILAAHHPMATGGPHGGNVSGFQSGPFIRYLAIKAGLAVQDLASGRYSAMLTRLRETILASGVTPLAFAAGHDHSLQVIHLDAPGEPSWQLVSGSASKSSPADRIRGTRYATNAHGYMRLDFTADATRLTVFSQRADTGTIDAAFGCDLSPRASSCPEAELIEGVR